MGLKKSERIGFSLLFSKKFKRIEKGIDIWRQDCIIDITKSEMIDLLEKANEEESSKERVIEVNRESGNRHDIFCEPHF